MNENELKINGYSLFRVDSYSRHTGGVAVYVHTSVTIDIIDSYSQNDIWSLTFRILSGYERDTFCVLYRGHKSTLDNFKTFLKRTLYFLSTNCQNFYVVGDFNYNYNNKSVSSTLLDILKSYSLSQIVRSYTHEQDNSQTLIDWVVTNRKSTKCHVINHNLIADHNFIALNLFSKREKSITKISKVDWSNYSKINLVSYLSSIDWQCYDMMDNVNSKFMFLHENFQQFLSQNVGVKSFSTKSSLKWYTKEHAEMKQHKIQAKIRWNKSKNQLDWKEYVKWRNLYKSSLRSSECNFLQHQLTENSNDSKKLWSVLKSIYSNDNKCALVSITFDDGIVCDSQTCADRLNEYFINSIVQISGDIPKVRDDLRFYVNFPQVSFSFQQVSYEQMRNLILDCKKKYYCDNLSGRVLADALECPDFLISFTDLINKSLKEGIVPDIFKISTVTPIPKIKNSTRVCDLRPINTLSVCSQILERIVKDQLLFHFESNNLFARQQSGFRQFHSCESSLALVTTDWIGALDKNKVVVAVFLDLKRAFETIDRKLLLHKLELYGCDPVVINWFSSYLHNRFQQTKFNGVISALLPIFIGIPQGSVLSCLLFIIFINDIVNVIEYTQIKLFADDTLIYIECDPENLDEAISRLNSDLHKIYEWLCYAKLSLNISKTKAMIVSNKKTLPKSTLNILINNEAVELVDSIKYLGIIIDRKLSFKEQQEDMLKKLNKKFYVFKRCEGKLNEESKKIFVQSLIFSHFNYCPTISFLFSDSQIDDFQKILNRFMRVILRRNSRAHRQDMLDALDWLSVKQMLNLNVLLFFHRLTMFESPDYLYFKLRKVSDTHRYPTSSADDYATPTYKNEFSQNSLFYKGVKLFNEFLNYRKAEFENRQAAFKVAARQFVKTKFPLSTET